MGSIPIVKNSSKFFKRNSNDENMAKQNELKEIKENQLTILIVLIVKIKIIYKIFYDFNCLNIILVPFC
jgi:hypothetical protein